MEIGSNVGIVLPVELYFVGKYLSACIFFSKNNPRFLHSSLHASASLGLWEVVWNRFRWRPDVSFLKSTDQQAMSHILMRAWRRTPCALDSETKFEALRNYTRKIKQRKRKIFRIRNPEGYIYKWRNVNNWWKQKIKQFFFTMK